MVDQRIDFTADPKNVWDEWRARRDAWRARSLEIAARPGGLRDLNADQLRAFGVECMDQLREAAELLRMGDAAW